MSKKIAYLTIDDSPSEDMKKKVDFLASRSIPAIWFCLGENIVKRPDYVKYAIENDFIIGNHAFNHLEFSSLSLDECYSQIKKGHDLIHKLYSETNVTNYPKFFRFPYGDKGGLKFSEVLENYSDEGLIRKNKIQDYLRSLGYFQPEFKDITYQYYRDADLLKDIDWYWSYDVLEWSIFVDEPLHGIDSLDKVFKRMDENYPEKTRGLNYNGSSDIILMHDHPETTDVFESIIDRLLKKGISFKLPDF